MDGICVYDNGLTTIQPGSWNVVSVSNPGAGLFDVVFSYTSRTGDAKRFAVRSHLALGSLGACDGNSVTIGVSTITIRINTRDKAGADANRSFNLSFEELG